MYFEVLGFILFILRYSIQYKACIDKLDKGNVSIIKHYKSNMKLKRWYLEENTNLVLRW
jgi:hypothetical protein